MVIEVVGSQKKQTVQELGDVIEQRVFHKLGMQKELKKELGGPTASSAVVAVTPATGRPAPATVTITADMMYDFKDAEGIAAEEHRTGLKMLSRSSDASRLSPQDLDINMAFIAVLTAHVNAIATEVLMNNRALELVSFDLGNKDINPKATKAVQNMRLWFNGSITTTPSNGSLKVMQAFGISFYMSSASSKALSSDKFPIAFAVPIVSDQSATFQAESLVARKCKRRTNAIAHANASAHAIATATATANAMARHAGAMQAVWVQRTVCKYNHDHKHKRNANHMNPKRARN